MISHYNVSGKPRAAQGSIKIKITPAPAAILTLSYFKIKVNLT